MSGASELERLQRWMQAVVMDPHGAARGLATVRARTLMPGAVANLESVVTRSRRQTALERLGVYAGMYYLRLIEVLTAEYPTTREVLGAEAFDRACRVFIARHPSTQRTLQSLSVGFPRFLKRHLKGRRNARLAVDVARIERAMEDVFDAPRAEPLGHEALRTIPAESWAEVRLKLTPALRLLALDCPANEYMTAVRARRRVRTPRARPAYVMVYRHRLRAWRMTITREQFTLLTLLGKGQPIGRAVYRSCRSLRVPGQRLPVLLSEWFRAWSAAGLFVALELPLRS